jgi:hypothetical protein
VNLAIDIIKSARNATQRNAQMSIIEE